jgi:formylglycine-generating enzyme required for sulfatase activity
MPSKNKVDANKTKDGCSSAHDIWFVAIGDRPSEEINIETLKRDIAEGWVPPQTLVWSEKIGFWAPAGRVPELTECFLKKDLLAYNTNNADRSLVPVVETGLKAGDVRNFTVMGASLEMVWCPPGEFMMGSPDSDKEAYCNEKPQHRVSINKGFWIGKYLVTQGQCEALGLSCFPRFQGEPDSDNRPAEMVPRDRFDYFSEYIESCTDVAINLRLPSEAEWEYACRAGCSSPRYGELDDIAWHRDNSESQTHPVGEKKPNAWGIYDMLGNVNEWVEDEYDYYPGAQEHGKKYPPGRSTFYVLRGGGWQSLASECRAAYRFSNEPEGYYYDPVDHHYYDKIYEDYSYSYYDGWDYDTTLFEHISDVYDDRGFRLALSPPYPPCMDICER